MADGENTDADTKKHISLARELGFREGAVLGLLALMIDNSLDSIAFQQELAALGHRPDAKKVPLVSIDATITKLRDDLGQMQTVADKYKHIDVARQIYERTVNDLRARLPEKYKLLFEKYLRP